MAKHEHAELVKISAMDQRLPERFAKQSAQGTGTWLRMLGLAAPRYIDEDTQMSAPHGGARL